MEVLEFYDPLFSPSLACRNLTGVTHRWRMQKWDMPFNGISVPSPETRVAVWLGQKLTKNLEIPTIVAVTSIDKTEIKIPADAKWYCGITFYESLLKADEPHITALESATTTAVEPAEAVNQIERILPLHSFEHESPIVISARELLLASIGEPVDSVPHNLIPNRQTLRNMIDTSV